MFLRHGSTGHAPEAREGGAGLPVAPWDNRGGIWRLAPINWNMGPVNGARVYQPCPIDTCQSGTQANGACYTGRHLCLERLCLLISLHRLQLRLCFCNALPPAAKSRRSCERTSDERTTFSTRCNAGFPHCRDSSVSACDLNVFSSPRCVTGNGRTAREVPCPGTGQPIRPFRCNNSN